MRKTGNQPECLGERSSTFEEQARSVLLESVEQGVERPADPEIFFDILYGGAEPVGSGLENVASIGLAGGNDGMKSRIHLFGFLGASSASRSSRTTVCIHAGSVEIPLRKSSRMQGPLRGFFRIDRRRAMIRS